MVVRADWGIIQLRGEVLKLADRHALGACAARREGSSPSFPTFSRPGKVVLGLILKGTAETTGGNGVTSRRFGIAPQTRPPQLDGEVCINSNPTIRVL